MTKIIDVRGSGGQLVVLGDAFALPTSNASTFVANTPIVAGSVRYNPDLNRVEYLGNADTTWKGLLSSGSSATLANGDYGDVTVSNSGATITIDPNVVTLGKIAQIANGVVLGRASLGTGNVEMLTSTDLGTILGLGTAASHAATDFLLSANNLSDVANAATTRTNLGLLRLIAFFFTTTPSSSEVLGLYVAADSFTIPANMVGTKVAVGTNPTATFNLDVQKNGTSIGTISIATTGVVTLTTVGGTSKSVVAGDIIKFVAPSTADATVANVAVNVMGKL